MKALTADQTQFNLEVILALKVLIIKAEIGDLDFKEIERTELPGLQEALVKLKIRKRRTQ